MNSTSNIINFGLLVFEIVGNPVQSLDTYGNDLVPRSYDVSYSSETVAYYW